jgi:hypothetical protein
MYDGVRTDLKRENVGLWNESLRLKEVTYGESL